VRSTQISKAHDKTAAIISCTANSRVSDMPRGKTKKTHGTPLKHESALCALHLRRVAADISRSAHKALFPSLTLSSGGSSSIPSPCHACALDRYCCTVATTHRDHCPNIGQKRHESHDVSMVILFDLSVCQ
jgi:hypothetical protein